MDAGVKHLNVHIYLVTLLYNKYYNSLISCPDLVSPILVRSAANSYLTSEQLSYCEQELNEDRLSTR